MLKHHSWFRLKSEEILVLLYCHLLWLMPFLLIRHVTSWNFILNFRKCLIIVSFEFIRTLRHTLSFSTSKLWSLEELNIAVYISHIYWSLFIFRVFFVCCVFFTSTNCIMTDLVPCYRVNIRHGPSKSDIDFIQLDECITWYPATFSSKSSLSISYVKLTLWITETWVSEAGGTWRIGIFVWSSLQLRYFPKCFQLRHLSSRGERITESILIGKDSLRKLMARSNGEDSLQRLEMSTDFPLKEL